jgi:diacylglycerol kinase (ATP)
MPADFVIIANPISGSRTGPKIAARVEQMLRTKGCKAELALTNGKGDAERIARDAALAGVRTVVGCGGDGTLHEIAPALEGSDTSLGIIPRGRCNDFGRALGLHRSDPLEKIVQILVGPARAIDLGSVGGKRFLTVATLGFDSEVSRYVESRNLLLRGTPAYLFGVIRTLIHFRAPRVRVRGDFGAFDGRILLAATGNTPCYGGAMRITPAAKLDDGLLELCLVKEVSRMTVLLMLPRVIKGTHVSHPAVRMFRARSFEIETPEQAHWICADGESLLKTPARFECRPRALNVQAPG